MFNHSGIMLQTVLSLMASTNNLTFKPNKTAVDNFENSTMRCFKQYGCFSISEPWTSPYRPISLLPESPEKINPIFCLYTRRNPTECQRLKVNLSRRQLEETNLSSYKTLTLVSHGYLENGNKLWLKNLTEKLLQHGDLNVIIIDWSGGSAPPYSQAVANIRVVGTMAAHLVGRLNQLGVNTSGCHVIGHSLGSHVAAYIGQILREKYFIHLARISALDPAKPHFSNTDRSMRLDPSDADFVDVVHTDTDPFISGGLGLLEPVGHVDFYPNGGVHQPGCSEGVARYIGMERGSFVGGIQKFLSCNHIRSYQYYTESISTQCPYIGISCNSWEEFQNGSCFSCTREKTAEFRRPGEHLCARFGYNSLNDLKQQPHARGLMMQKFFFMTNSGSPFCQEHYRITLKISDSMKSIKHGGEIGKFWVTVLGADGSSHRIPLSQSEQYYEPGSRHQVVVGGKGVGRFWSATVEWEYRMSFLNPLSWRVLSMPSIYLDWMTIEKLEDAHSIALCMGEGQPIVSTKPVSLHHRESCREQVTHSNTT